MKYLSLLIVYLIPMFGWSQTGQEIIAKHRAATGADLRANIKSMIMLVEVQNPAAGGKMAMDLHLQRPDKISIRTDVMGQKIVMVQNGQEFWMINPLMGAEPQSIPVAQQDQFAQAMENMDGQFADYKEHPEYYEYLGKASLEGVEYHKVKVLNRPHVDQAIVFFDANDNFVRRMEMKIQGYDVYRTLGDYRMVSGIQMPFEISTFMDESLVSSMLIKEVKINQDIDPGLFDKP